MTKEEIQYLTERITNLESQVRLLTDNVLEIKANTWVTRAELAAKLKISERTIIRWQERAEIGIHYRLHGGKSYRYHVENFGKLIRGES